MPSRNLSLLPVAFAALAIAAASPAYAQQQPAPSSPFVRQVLAQFDRWDTDRDGALSVSEVDAQVRSLDTSGPAAAALSAIKRVQRWSLSAKAPLPPLTREYFLAYGVASKGGKPVPELPVQDSGDTSIRAEGENGEGVINAPEDGTDKKPSSAPRWPRYERLYAEGKGRIRDAPRVLYTAAGPQLANIRQESLGDCSLLSAIGGLLSRDRAAFTRMITQQPDGSCKVVFPSGRTITVENLTDTEVALSSGTSGTGRWLAVLEEAYGTLKNDTRPEDEQENVATDLIWRGASIHSSIQNLTGHVAVGMGLRKKVKGKWQTLTAAQVAPRLPGLRDKLSKTLGAGLLAGAIVDKYARPPGITGNHAYAVLAYSAKTDTVRLWNPHGNSFRPKSAPGLKSGYLTKNGIFEMPLADFAQVFCRLDLETATPRKPVKRE